MYLSSYLKIGFLETGLSGLGRKFVLLDSFN